MLEVCTWLMHALSCWFKSRDSLVLENLALRHQLTVLVRKHPRPKLRRLDRMLWAWLSQHSSGWQNALLLVKPETVIAWHRLGFRLFWRFKSRGRLGRPQLPSEVRELIRQMSRDNLWGAPRIHGELLKLGFTASQATVARLMRRPRKPPSQTWRTFLANHVGCLASIDFCVVRTVTFKMLFVFVVLAHARRRVVHFNVTSAPTAEWTAQQVVQAFPDESAPRYLIRDHDGIYGSYFRQRLASMGIEEVVTAIRSPWQNAFCERLIGSLRRECLDHVIVLSEDHLRRILREYFDRYYHTARTHLALEKDCPIPRALEPPDLGPVRALPILGGLHHQYTRSAAA